MPFLVMEYLDGRPLSELIAEGPMEVSAVVRYGRQIAEALACAHGTGIIHRDLKPANVIVSREDVDKVLDFGLAKSQLTELDETRAALTQEGLSLGTVQYMSPERIRGTGVDAESDVFSLGIVLYEMLCGARPFSASNVFGIADRIQTVEPTPIDERRPDVPPALRAVVGRALRKRPDERFRPRARSRRCFATSSASSARVRPVWLQRLPNLNVFGRGEQLRARLPLRPVIVAIGLTVGIVAATAWGFAGVSSGPSSALQSSAGPSSASAATASPTELTRQGHALLYRCNVADNVERALASFTQALSRDESNAFAHAGLAQGYYWKDATTPDPQLIRLASASARRAVELNPDIAAAHLATGIVLFKQGEHGRRTRRWRRRARWIPRTDASGYGGEVQRQRRLINEADAHFREAAALAPDDWMVHLSWGRLQSGAARYAEAVAEWERARALASDNVLVLRNLAAAYRMINRTDDAAAALQRRSKSDPLRASTTIWARCGFSGPVSSRRSRRSIEPWS